jgi:hypothetical protein
MIRNTDKKKRRYPNTQIASLNLDSFIEWSDNPLANVSQINQHNSKFAGLLEIAGTKTPHIITVIR